MRPKPKCCEMCERETRLSRHHEDYSKPNEVVWVCGSCHRKIHYNNVFTPKHPKRKKERHSNIQASNITKYIKASNAAKIKGVSRGCVIYAVDAKRISSAVIDGTPYILNNRAFEVWNPGVKK